VKRSGGTDGTGAHAGRNLRHEVMAALTGAGLAPLHRLGQNFMVDARALDRLIAELALSPGERVVEVGPGTGVLTARLLAAGATLLAVELDRGLAALIGARFAGQTLTLEHGDALDGKSRLHPVINAFARQPWKLGANLPYDVAIPVLLNAASLVAPELPPALAVVTVQWEAAQRLVSRPGQDAWGASAAVLQAAGEPTLVCRLPPHVFHPRPRVDSAILRWVPMRALPAGFPAWCRRVFAARRKVLPGALRDAGHPRVAGEAACRACGLDPARRLETLHPAELVALHAALAEADQKPE